jgi:hypothetical protein
VLKSYLYGVYQVANKEESSSILDAAKWQREAKI